MMQAPRPGVPSWQVCPGLPRRRRQGTIPVPLPKESLRQSRARRIFCTSAPCQTPVALIEKRDRGGARSISVFPRRIGRTICTQGFDVLTVSQLVALQLRCPIGSVAFRNPGSRVTGMGFPETAVDEDALAANREHPVRLAYGCCQDRHGG